MQNAYFRSNSCPSVSSCIYTDSNSSMLDKELTERGIKGNRSFSIFSKVPKLTWRCWWKPRKPSEMVPGSTPRLEPEPVQIRTRSSLSLDHDAFVQSLLYFNICWTIFMKCTKWIQNRGFTSVHVSLSKLISRSWCTFVHMLYPILYARIKLLYIFYKTGIKTH
jgi:hypothetical protein